MIERDLYVVRLLPANDHDALCVGPLEATDAYDAAHEALKRLSHRSICQVVVWCFVGSEPALVLETDDEIAQLRESKAWG